MTEDKYIALMNQELDGVNSPGQARELAAYLDSDPEARQYFQELQDALQIFQKVDLIDPPGGLAELIDESVNAVDRARAAARVAENTPSVWRRFFQPNRVVAFTTGALCGLIVFAGVTQFNPGGGDSRSAWIRGTATTMTESPSHYRAGGLGIDLPGVTGQVSVLDGDPGTLIRLEIAADEKVKVRLNYGAALAFNGYHATHGKNYQLTRTETTTELEHQGDGDYYFLFSHTEGTDAVIEIDVQTAGGQRAVLPVKAGGVKNNP